MISIKRIFLIICVLIMAHANAMHEILNQKSAAGNTALHLALLHEDDWTAVQCSLALVEPLPYACDWTIKNDANQTNGDLLAIKLTKNLFESETQKNQDLIKQKFVRLKEIHDLCGMIDNSFGFIKDETKLAELKSALRGYNRSELTEFYQAMASDNKGESSDGQ